MIGHLAVWKRTVLAALLLLSATFAGRAESVVASTDIWYDEQTDEVVFWVYTESDYNTAYYYEVWSGSEISKDGQVFVGWGITSQPGVPYVWGWNTTPAQPGVVYGNRTRHEVRAYYEWCEITYPYECYDWYDVFGYDLLPSEQPPWGTYWIQVPPMVVCWTAFATVAEAVTEMFADPPVPVLSCNPQSVTRGANVTCTVSGAGFSRVSSWRFEGGGATVTGPSSGASWGGTMVQGGTVTATIQGYTPSLQQSIAVNNRSWGSQVVPADSVPNGTFATLPTPPYEASGTLGQFMWQTYSSVPNPTQVPGGPNSGFFYFASPLSLDQFYMYEVNPDLTNTQSVFAQRQFGNCGVISRPSLENNVVEHESSSQSGVHSHYNEYKTFLTSQDRDPNVLVEQSVASPGSSPTQFRTDTNRFVLDRLFFIGQDVAFETGLYAANQNQTTGLPMGNINWPPYPYTCP